MEPSKNFHNWNSDPLFPVALVASIAGIDAATLRKWLVRYRDDGILPWEPAMGLTTALGKAPEGDGFPAHFTFNGVLHIAATARLVAAGVGVPDAYWSAAKWTMAGESVAYWVGEPVPKSPRAPAGLFPLPDHTFLIHYGGRDAKVVRVPQADGSYLFPREHIATEPTATPPRLLLLNYLDAHARKRCWEFLPK